MSGYCEVLRLLRNRGGEGFDTLAWEQMSSSFIEAEIWEPAGWRYEGILVIFILVYLWVFNLLKYLSS